MNLQKRLLKVLRDTHNPSLYLLTTMLVEDNKGKEIQEALRDLGADITVDGIVGYYTIKAILSVDEDKLAKAIIDLSDKHIYGSQRNADKYNSISPKDRIMNYLARYEGTIIHWNRTETNMTTPYGIYRKSFPNAVIFKYIDALSVKYTGRVIRRRDLRQIGKLNNSLTRNERRRIKDMAWDFYLNNFMNPEVTDMLDGKEGMSFFSISVNGGRGRGIKSLYSATKLKLKNRVSDVLLNKISELKRKHISLNDGMLDYMLNFYKYLIRKNPNKYGRYRNGWFSRLKGLR